MLSGANPMSLYVNDDNGFLLVADSANLVRLYSIGQQTFDRSVNAPAGTVFKWASGSARIAWFVIGAAIFVAYVAVEIAFIIITETKNKPQRPPLPAIPASPTPTKKVVALEGIRLLLSIANLSTGSSCQDRWDW